MYKFWIGCLFLCCGSGSVFAQYNSAALDAAIAKGAIPTESKLRPLAGLEAHEPTYVGYTLDDRGDRFMDFKISLRYPILHDSKSKPAYKGFLPYPYFAFTGRFGQYIGTRDSSPVLSKRFNPELFARYWLDHQFGNNQKLDLVLLGHESNGQSVTDSEQYDRLVEVLVAEGEEAVFANDYVSRGWDYIGLRWSGKWLYDRGRRSATTYLYPRYFHSYGPLQGRSEQYNQWENDPAGKPRKAVDGLTAQVRFDNLVPHSWLGPSKLFVSYTTGYDQPFKYSTLRVEMDWLFGNLPLMLWVSHGYNSDITDYYRSVNEVGIAVEFLSFH